jgi:hypothetical protein
MKSHVLSIAIVSLKVVCTIAIVLGVITMPIFAVFAPSNLDAVWGDDDEI